MPEAYFRSRCGEGVAVEQDFSMYAQGQRRKGPALRRAVGGERQGEERATGRGFNTPGMADGGLLASIGG